jgi:hypothetical protein
MESGAPTVQKNALVSYEALNGPLIGLPFLMDQLEGVPMAKPLHHFTVCKADR